MAGAGAGLDQLCHVAWLLEGGGNKLYERFYADILKVNVQPLMIQPMGPDPLGWFKRPIKDVADFKTMKYRSPPGITGEIFKEMGVSAVALPGGEIVPAAQRGTIDAAEWIGPADDRNLGLHTVWKNYYLQGLHQSTDIGEVLFNKAWWDKLTPDLQEILEGAALASMMETYSFNVWRNAQAIVELREKHGVQILDTPKEFFPEFVAPPTSCSTATPRRTPSSRRCSTASASSPRRSCRTGRRSSISIPSSATRRSKSNSPPEGRVRGLPYFFG